MQVEEAKTVLRNTSNLDKLERDLGLDSMDDPYASGWNVTTAPFSSSSNSTWTSVKGVAPFDNIPEPSSSPTTRGLFRSSSLSKTSNDAPVTNDIIPNEEEDCGYIAHNWLAANFTGCLPPIISLAIYDWAILHEEKYAGLFLIASLLEIYSDMLLSMNGKQIKAWFYAIASGQDDWFKLLPAAAIRRHFPVGDNNSNPSMNASVYKLNQWKEFVAGWLHVTTAMSRKTPSAFISALKGTEAWCEDAVTRCRNNRK